VVFRGALHQLACEIAFVADVFFALPALHAVRAAAERCKCARGRSAPSCAGRKTSAAAYGCGCRPRPRRSSDNLVVAQFSGVEIVLADAGAERSDDGANFFVPSICRSVLFDVEDFPFERRIAWYFLSRPCFAEPPADSPSTTNNSQRAGSRSWQSASFPGKPLESMADLRRVSSRAFRAASRARAASMHLK